MQTTGTEIFILNNGKHYTTYFVLDMDGYARRIQVDRKGRIRR